ncbi:MAG: DUF2723 domain-containing protein [Gemmatimonadales bacterium]
MKPSLTPVAAQTRVASESEDSPIVPSAAVAHDRRLQCVAAIVLFGVVLAGYVWTLAPTVTLWDAGEFIATSKILGIPHPPGTPLFTMMANVWGRVVAIGGFAYRTNLMTATFSAGGAALFFLLLLRTLRGRTHGLLGDRTFALGGAAAAAIISAFVFTVWQNSNETEVYVVATFSIGATALLAWLWRENRGRPRAAQFLLLAVYLQAISLGSHLLALLVGPALIVFVAHVLKTEPLEFEQDRRVEWAQWAMLNGAWLLMLGTGLGNSGILLFGGLAFLGAAGYATKLGGVRFAAMILGVVLLGATVYGFLYIRAQHGPFINEADPATWESLKAVIARKQYPPRSPFDNPIFPSGPDNPGRSLTLIMLQIQNYLQYFDWQWANGLAPTDPVFARNTPLVDIPFLKWIPARIPFTLFFVTLGIYGARILKERDRSVFWLLITLFAVTGPGLMGYMNFKPGYSLGWNVFPGADMHEVRERDYFFTVSFQVWGMLAGIGLAGIYRSMRDRLARHGVNSTLASSVFLIALLPFGLNFKAASRKHGPEAEFARDFAYDLLQSAEPYGIIFTLGDNDTFPLWYAQEVEKIRQDVSVVNLSLGNTAWYIRQLRDNPVRPFDREQAPWFAGAAPDSAPPPLHSMSDAQIATLRASLLSSPVHFREGRIDQTYQANTPLYVKDVLILRLVQENWRRRPIYFSLTVGDDSWLQLGQYLTQEGLLLKLNIQSPPDTTRLGPGILRVPVDVPRTDSLVWKVYRYADLFTVDSLELDPWNRNIATNLSFAFYSLTKAYVARGDGARGLENFQRAFHLSPLSQSLIVPPAPAAAPSPVSGDTPIGR